MKPYPHAYTVSVEGTSEGLVSITAPQLPGLQSAPPPEFDGPAGLWSPETLLCASLADCFILTFRSVARAARFEWGRLNCRVEGILERIGNAAQFTRFTTFVELSIPPGADAGKARSLVERAEHSCLIANSLRASRALELSIHEAR